jgi:hypothetical protein
MHDLLVTAVWPLGYLHEPLCALQNKKQHLIYGNISKKTPYIRALKTGRISMQARQCQKKQATDHLEHDKRRISIKTSPHQPIK